MQVAFFRVGAAEAAGQEELNRFLRGHRVLTLDKVFHDGFWAVCVTYAPGPAAGADSARPPKVDYREVLDEPTFALFSRLREVRKGLAEQERLPAYAIFTNGQLAEIAKARCTTPAALGQIEGVGPARVEKYGAALLAVLCEAATAPERPLDAPGGPARVTP